jgi:hypothetical protein
MSKTSKPTRILLIVLFALLFIGAIIVDLIINPLPGDDKATAQATDQAAFGTAAIETAMAATQAAIETGTAQAVSATQTAGDEAATAAAATTTAVWLVADDDLDDLTNGQELENGTRPDEWDSDGDGLSDGIEVKELGSDPLKPDTDGDGTPDPDDEDPGQVSTPTSTDTPAPTPTDTPTITPTPTPTPLLIVEFEEINYTIDEQDDEAVITVILNEAVDVPVRVDYDTIRRGTADAGEDYITTSGRLLFSPGDTEETFSIPILDDPKDEDDEIIVVELSDPENIELGSNSQTRLTIIDDDEVSVFFSRLLQTELVQAAQTPRYQVGEGRQATILVELSALSARIIRVEYATQDGTAIAGEDYNSVRGILTFNPGG